MFQGRKYSFRLNNQYGQLLEEKAKEPYTFGSISIYIRAAVIRQLRKDFPLEVRRIDEKRALSRLKVVKNWYSESEEAIK